MIIDVGDGRAVTSLPESIWAIAKYRERMRREHERSGTWLRALKLVCLAALLLKIVFWTGSAPLDPALRITIALGGTLLAGAAAFMQRYGSTVLFAAIAVLFNPFVPLLTFSGAAAFVLVVATAAAFGLSPTLEPKRPAFAGRG